MSTEAAHLRCTHGFDRHSGASEPMHRQKADADQQAQTDRQSAVGSP